MTGPLWAAATLTALTTLAPPAHAAILQHYESRDSLAHASPAMGHPPYAVDARHDSSPVTVTVTLGATFSPASVTLTSGERLLITVSSDVTATTGAPADGVLTGGPLGPGSYLYVGAKPGTVTLTALVGPHCLPAEMCPQWRTAPRLTVTVLP